MTVPIELVYRLGFVHPFDQGRVHSFNRMESLGPIQLLNHAHTLAQVKENVPHG